MDRRSIGAADVIAVSSRLFDFLTDTDEVAVRVDDGEFFHAPGLYFDGVKVGQADGSKFIMEGFGVFYTPVATEEALCWDQISHEEEVQLTRFPSEDRIVAFMAGPNFETEALVVADRRVKIEGREDRNCGL